MGPGFEPLRAYEERDWDNIKIPFILGGMVEWSITTVLKTVVLRGTGGSNPSPSAKKESHKWLFLAFWGRWMRSRGFVIACAFAEFHDFTISLDCLQRNRRRSHRFHWYHRFFWSQEWLMIIHEYWRLYWRGLTSNKSLRAFFLPRQSTSIHTSIFVNKYNHREPWMALLFLGLAPRFKQYFIWFLAEQ